MKIKVIDIAKMKSAIKVMVELQKSLKNQRKTVKLVGKRTMSPSDATFKHMTNREDLRIMYAAYGIARGKTVSQIETHHPADNHPLNWRLNQKRINTILETYKTLVVEVETAV